MATKTAKFSLVIVLLMTLGLEVGAVAGWDQDQADIARVRPRLGDRFYLEAVLLELFGPGAQAVLQTHIIQPDSIVGGPCDLYEMERTGMGASDFADQRTRCFSGKMGMTLSMVPRTNLVRQGYIMKACTKLSQDPMTLNFFLNRHLGPVDPKAPVTDEQLVRLFKAFRPTESPPQRVVDALNRVARTPASAQPALSAVVLTLCLDPAWQVL